MSQDSQIIKPKNLFSRRRLRQQVQESDEEMPVQTSKEQLAAKLAEAANDENVDTAVSSKRQNENNAPAGKRLRRKIKKIEADNESEQALSDAKPASKEEEQSVEEKLNKMKTKIMGRKAAKKSAMEEYDLEAVELSDGEPAKVPKARKQKKPVKKQALQNIDMNTSLNLIKVKNKLIGAIENNDLYNSDEAIMHENVAQSSPTNVFRNEELNFEATPKKEQALDLEKPAGDKGKFLMKMKTKKMDANNGIESQVINLGFVSSVAQKLNANQLAASGIQLSLKESLISFIKNSDQDKIGAQEKNLLTALEGEQPEQIDSLQKKVSEDKPSTSHEPSKPELSREQSEEEDTGLVFYDPMEEERLKKQAAMIEKQRDRQNLLKEGTNAGAIHPQSSMLSRKSNHRMDFFKKLQNQKKQQHAMTLVDVKQTFQATELNVGKGSKKSKGTDDGLIEDRESDSDFNEEDNLPTKVWDDEENYVGDSEEREVEQGAEEEGEEEASIECDKISVEEQSDASSVIAGRQRRRRVVDKTAEVVEKVKARKEKKKKLQKFFDEEAELGSDNEDNDDQRRQINKNDAEENEEGLDADLQDFVVNADEKVIGEAEEGMMQKFMEDMHNDERKKTAELMNGVIHGFNKKRKRDEVQGLDNDDEFEKRKAERLQERGATGEEKVDFMEVNRQKQEEADRQKRRGGKDMNSQEMEELEDDLLIGTGKARERQAIKQLIEDEKLSDEEDIKEVMENNKYYAFMREKKLADITKNLNEQEKKMEVELEEMGELVVDQNLMLKKSSTNVSNKTDGNTRKMNGFNRFNLRGPLNQKKVEAVQTEGQGKKSDIGPVSTGMQRFMKGDSAPAQKADKRPIPAMFRRRK